MADPRPPRLYSAFRYPDPEAVLDWLRTVAGARLHARHPQVGPLEHAEVALGTDIVTIGPDRDDAFARPVGRPGRPSGAALYVAVADPDAVLARALAAGAPVLQPPTDRAFGSREVMPADPGGHVWVFGTWRPAADRSPAIARRRASA